MRALSLLLLIPLAGCGLGNALIGFPEGENTCFPNEFDFFSVGPGFNANVSSELFDSDCNRTLPGSNCEGDQSPQPVVMVSLSNDSESFVEMEVVANWTFDGYLAVSFDADDPVDSCLAANDDDGGTERSRVLFGLAPGDFVSVLFSSFSGSTGSFNADIRALQ
jgi:hypothetical protein